MGELVDGTPKCLVIDSNLSRVKVRFRLLDRANTGLWYVRMLADPGWIRECKRVFIVSDTSTSGYSKNRTLFIILMILGLFFMFIVIYRYIWKHSNRAAKVYSEEIVKINEFLLNNLSKNLSIEEIATQVGMSPSTLRRVYKKACRTTIKSFILEERLKKAKEWLAKTDKSISRISYDLGINEPSYFSRLYKERFGISPQDYRNKNFNR
jgi:AraC-like DNA-binding protein